MNQIPDNVTVGEGTIVEEGVTLGHRYHADCGVTKIGRQGILRMGTIIYADVEVGDYFQTGHHVVVRAKVKMGDYCCLLNHSTIEGLVRFGTGVRIMSHVYIPSRTWFGDHVFVGPGTTFLNDRLPLRAGGGAYPEPRGATVEDDVMIGGGCTILPGITIGARSFIAAGAVVTKDIPPKSFVRGVPGRIEPLPAELDMPNDRRVTVQPLDIWHPRIPNLAAMKWPERWGKV